MTSIARVNDIEIPIVIDTGASQSVIPYSMVEKHKFPYYRSNITCKFGNNSKQENVLVTYPLDVVLFDTLVQLEFIILPRHNILLGCDWLNLTETVVSTYNKSLIFKQRKLF